MHQDAQAREQKRFAPTYRSGLPEPGERTLSGKTAEDIAREEKPLTEKEVLPPKEEPAISPEEVAKREEDRQKRISATTPKEEATTEAYKSATGFIKGIKSILDGSPREYLGAPISEKYQIANHLDNFVRFVDKAIGDQYAVMEESARHDKSLEETVSPAAYIRSLPSTTKLRIDEEVGTVKEEVAKLAGRAGLTDRELQTYSSAITSQEREAQSLKRGKKYSSGWKAKDAQTYVDTLREDPKKAKALDKIFGPPGNGKGSLMGKISDAHLRAMVEAGDITTKMADFYQKEYGQWSSLKDVEKKPLTFWQALEQSATQAGADIAEKVGATETAKRLQRKVDVINAGALGTKSKPEYDLSNNSMTAREARISEGRATPADAPLSWAFKSTQDAIVRAERARANQEVFRFVSAMDLEARVNPLKTGALGDSRFITMTEMPKKEWEQTEDGSYRPVWYDWSEVNEQHPDPKKIYTNPMDQRTLQNNETYMFAAGSHYRMVANPENNLAMTYIRALKGNDMFLVTKMNGDLEHILKPVVKGLESVGRTVTGLITRHNPLFFTGNAPKDAVDAFANSYIWGGKKVAGRYVANYVPEMFKAIVGKLADESSLRTAQGRFNPASLAQSYMNVLRGNHPEMMHDYMAHGGSIEFSKSMNADETGESLKKLISLYSSQDNWGEFKKQIFGLTPAHLIKPFDLFNEAIDLAPRLAVYKAYKDCMPEEIANNPKARELYLRKAAVASRDATVDFNMKGTATPLFNGLYWFFNASTQGIRQITRPIMRGGDVRSRAFAAYGAMAAVGATLSAINRMGGGLQSQVWENLPPYLKTSRMIYLMHGAKYAATIPLAFGGAGLSFILGGILEDALHNGMKNTVPKLQQLVNAADPLGSGGDILGATTDPQQGMLSLMQELWPSTIKPVMGLATNRDNLGRTIVPESDVHGSFGKSKDPRFGIPNYLRFNPDKTGQFYRNAASSLFNLSGGKIDVSPAQLDYLAQSYSGFIGSEGARADRAITEVKGNMAQGMSLRDAVLNLSPKNVPALNRYMLKVEEHGVSAQHQLLSEYSELSKVGREKAIAKGDASRSEIQDIQNREGLEAATLTAYKQLNTAKTTLTKANSRANDTLATLPANDPRAKILSERLAENTQRLSAIIESMTQIAQSKQAINDLQDEYARLAPQVAKDRLLEENRQKTIALASTEKLRLGKTAAALEGQGETQLSQVAQDAIRARAQRLEEIRQQFREMIQGATHPSGPFPPSIPQPLPESLPVVPKPPTLPPFVAGSRK